MIARAVVFAAVAVLDGGAGGALDGVTIPGAANTIDVSASASAASVIFGARLELAIDVEHPVGIPVNLPASLDFGVFEELERSQREVAVSPDRVRQEYRLTIAAYGLGPAEIPALPVTAVVAGSAVAIETEAIAVEIASYVGAGEPAPRPPGAPVAVLRRQAWPLWAAGGLVAAVALVFAGAALRRVSSRRRGTGHGARAAVSRASAYDEALSRLSKLEASGALDADDLKPAYFEMSEILRDYVGRRFGFPGIDFTTAEVSAELARREAAGPLAARVASWLETADFVKFAGYPASADEARQALYQARQFVNESSPRAPANEGRRG